MHMYWYIVFLDPVCLNKTIIDDGKWVYVPFVLHYRIRLRIYFFLALFFLSSYKINSIKLKWYIFGGNRPYKLKSEQPFHKLWIISIFIIHMSNFYIFLKGSRLLLVLKFKGVILIKEVLRFCRIIVLPMSDFSPFLFKQI